MKTIIAGSRDITNYRLVSNCIREAWAEIEGGITEIVSGGAMGVDRMGELFAQSACLPLKVIPADWKRHGNAAGPIRNREMAKYADVLIAIWDGESRGTRNMISEARKRGLQVFIFEIQGKRNDRLGERRPEPAQKTESKPSVTAGETAPPTHMTNTTITRGEGEA